MANYPIKDASGKLIATRKTKADALTFLRADIAFRGDWGPYTIDTSGDVYVAGTTLSRQAFKNVGTIIPRTDTNVPDPRYPNGVVPGAPDIVIANVPPITTTDGLPFVTMNFATLYASGAGLAGATHSIVAVSGNTLVSMGFIFSGTSLSSADVNVGQGQFQYKISKSGFDFFSNTFSITVNAAAAAVAYRPTFLSIIPDSGLQQITVSGDWGNGDVEIWRQVDGGASALVQTLSIGSNTQPALVFSLNTIGGATAGTTSVSGADLTISNVVDGGYANTMDATNFYNATVTLPVGASVNCTLPVFNSPSQYSETGTRIAQSNTPLAPSVILSRRPAALNQLTPMLSRATQGATVTYKVDATLPNTDVDARVVRLSNNDFRFDQYNPSGTGQILNITTHTVPMTGPVQVGVYLDRVELGAGISATNKNFYVNALGQFNWIDVSTPQGHTYSYSVRTKIGSTFSDYSASVSGSITPNNSTAIKYHPGIYDQFTPGAVNGLTGYRFDLPEFYNQVIAHFDRIKNDPSVKGILVNGYPRAYEGPTPNDWVGFTAVDAMVAKAASVGKRLMLRYETGIFGGYGNLNTIYPQYIIDDNVNLGLTPLISLQNGVLKGQTMCNWRPACMDRIIATMQAYGARYNNNPYFELMTPIGETSISVQNGVAGFSPENYRGQIIRAMPLWRAAWPNTMLRIGVNDMGVDANIQAIYAAAVPYGIGMGGPDVWPGDVDQSLRLFTGLDSNFAPTLTNYSAVLPWAIEAQYQSFQGRWQISELWSAMVNGYTGVDDHRTVSSPKVKYLIMYVNESAGGPPQQYATGELPFYASVSGRVYTEGGVTPVPTSFTGGIIT